MLTTFRESLKPVRLRWLVLVVVAAAVPVTRLVLYALTHLQYVLKPVPGHAFNVDDDKYDKLNDLVLQVLSLPFTTAASSKQIVDDFSAVGVSGVLVLVTALLIAGCVTLRVAATAFRFKHQLFNLADQPDSAVHRTTSTWHVPRTTGLYERERRVHSAAGVLAAKEKPLDLWLSGVIITLIGWFFITYEMTDFSDNKVSSLEDLEVVLPLVGLRIGWLIHVGRQRSCQPTVWQTPTAAVLPGTGQVVDCRSPAEALFYGVVAPFPWFRLSRQMWHLEAEARLQRGSHSLPGRVERVAGIIVAGLSAVAVWYAPVFVIRAWRIHRLRRPGSRVPGLLTMAVAGVIAPVGFYAFEASGVGTGLEAVALVAWLLGSTIGIGAAQLAQNELVRVSGDPLPFDLVDGLPNGQARFHAPPGWPAPPPGWVPSYGWMPDPAWGPPPPGWRFWRRDTPAVPAQATPG